MSVNVTGVKLKPTQCRSAGLSITVCWDDDTKNIGRLNFYDRWTLQDLAPVEQQVRAMVQDAGQVGLIIDLRKGPVLPDRIIDHAAQVADMRSDKLDGISHFAVVGCDTLGKTLFKSFCKVCRPNKLMNKLTFVDTIEEARAVLAQYTPSRT